MKRLKALLKELLLSIYKGWAMPVDVNRENGGERILYKYVCPVCKTEQESCLQGCADHPGAYDCKLGNFICSKCETFLYSKNIIRQIRILGIRLPLLFSTKSAPIRNRYGGNLK